MRLDVDLGPRYRSILSTLGLVLALCGAIMLSPLVALWWWPTEGSLAFGFLVVALPLCVGGCALWRGLRPRRGPVLSIQEGGIIVLLSWVVVPLVSSLPLATALDLTVTQAVFESVSGWTTTGLSVVDVERAPRTILLWRSVMQLAGGAGIAIVLVTLAGGPLGPGVTAAEGRSDQLVPHVRRSARLVLALYAGYAAGGTAALRAAGMSWFDAVNHSFAAVSTGGFSTRAASVGAWDSPLVEGVVITLMVLGSTNFQIAYLALRGRFRSVLRNGEVRTAGALALVTIPLMVGLVTTTLYAGAGKQVRVAVFEVMTALTTTGFTISADALYRALPPIGLFLLIPLMIVGGGTGSTAGGMKQLRVYILAKAVGWELRRRCAPRRAVVDASVWRGDERAPVSDREIVESAVFAAAYLALYGAGAGLLVAYGHDLQESLFEYASALGTVGLSVGVTAATAPAPVLWAEIAAMSLGRLEILIVLVALRKLLADGQALVRSARR